MIVSFDGNFFFFFFGDYKKNRIIVKVDSVLTVELMIRMIFDRLWKIHNQKPVETIKKKPVA